MSQLDEVALPVASLMQTVQLVDNRWDGLSLFCPSVVKPDAAGSPMSLPPDLAKSIGLLCWLWKRRATESHQLIPDANTVTEH